MIQDRDDLKQEKFGSGRFLGFMNRVVAAFPDRELHVVLDNLNTHKECDRWLKKHPNVYFDFTPTPSSWLNRIETWFSHFAASFDHLNSVPSIHIRCRTTASFRATTRGHMEKDSTCDSVGLNARGAARTHQ
jgi:transposase